MKYRGREFTAKELDFIRSLIHLEGSQGRNHLSRRICEEFQWKKFNGDLKDMACRVAMLQMQNDGIIVLPLVKGASRRPKPVLHTLFGEPGAPLRGQVHEFFELRVELIQNRVESKLWNELIDRYHYLGYKPLTGAQLRYLIYDGDRILGCLGFCSASWKTASRDEWIGWSAAQRENKLHLIINNSRFLILPWIEVKGLASKTLGVCLRRIVQDWFNRYSYRPLLAETFVEKERFRGTCYKASNWVCVGDTKGRGRYDQNHKNAQPIKSIWLYPLNRDFKGSLCQ